jgi:hypothetical protein
VNPHYTRLREQYQEHKKNALWWRDRYRSWGGNFEYKWACSEFRLARRYLKYMHDAAEAARKD